MKNLTYDDVNDLKQRIMEVLFEFERQFENVEAHILTATRTTDTNAGAYETREVVVTVHHKIQL
jgi:hypothetical protein